MRKFVLIFTLFFGLTGGARAAGFEFLDDAAEPHFDLSFTVQNAPRGGLTVAFDYVDQLNFYSLELMPDTAALRAIIGGQPLRLSTSKVALTSGTKVTIKRRPWTMQVLVGNRVALTAFDGTLTKGKIGFLASGGWSWKDARMQPVDPEIFYNDDFTRQAGQGNDWVEGAGKWTLTASSDAITAKNVAMSANPFSFQTTTPLGSAFALVEPRKARFWDNYDAQVSVRPSGQGTVGLAVYVQDAKNYLAFVWQSAEGPAARQLVRVEDGKPTVLARAPGAFLPRQWYRLGVRTSPGAVECFIDGSAVIKIADDSFGQGGIGLLATTIGTANFDDVRIRSYDYFRLNFSGEVSGAWTGDLGAWTQKNGVLASAPTKEDKGATRLYLTGRSDWPSYQFSVQARSGTSGVAGAVVGYRDNQNYTIFRWAGENSAVAWKGRQQIMVFRAGKAQIVRDEPSIFTALGGKEGFVPITLRVAPGVLAVYVNGKLLAQRADEAITPGRPGLYAQGLTTSFFRDAVMYFPPAPEAAKVPPLMAEDPLMVGWASPSGEWPVSAGEGGAREFWNTGEFFGDGTLDYLWRRATTTGNRIDFALRAEKGKFESGYVLRCEGLGKKDGVRLTLMRGTAELKRANIALQDVGTEAENPDDPKSGLPLKVQMEGRGLLIYVNQRPVMSYVAGDVESVPTGTRLAARSATSVVRTSNLRAFSANSDDYTFTEAPTDWYSLQGGWSVISRWPCYSDWSFFGGKGLNPALWSKRSYGLDTVVEFYANNQMDLPKELGYSNPGNINVTILGDGKNPSSGYSFVVAGWNNTRSRILRGDQVVADLMSEKARFPRPINQNLSFHKRWFYVRAEVRAAKREGKSGLLLRLSMDDETLLEYFDASPLPAAQKGGHVGFWTLDSAMMIARAKIESVAMGERAIPAGLVDAEAPLPGMAGLAPDALAPRPVESDSLPSTVIEGGSAWTVKNATSGGLFAVNLVVPAAKPAAATKVAVKADSRLDFEWLPGDSKVDLYANVGDDLLLYALTTEGVRDARVKLLGDAHKESGIITDLPNGWQKVSIPLGALLTKQIPGKTEWELDALTLGVFHGDQYRLQGFGGNALGTSYKIKNVRLSG